ncbi:MAG: flavodoxin-dependent (E)-4-hydroxy-3-methylbut-2-enyl-diphosphate synthase, partial [Omnitrophica bacterium]|nr:flavodoxin-dependent (E)-4-hydroxy-3-methylbut-2-enyl-diphosphate synthase [Candidatus Omnitrophota bacterium]
MKRRKTRIVKVGNVKVGGGSPIAIQSMAKTDTRDVRETVSEIRGLEKAGCEIVRVAVKDREAAQAIKAIKQKIKIPLVADIHFDYRLALLSIKMGADKIRINPGNISRPDHLAAIIKAAKKQKIP